MIIDKELFLAIRNCEACAAISSRQPYQQPGLFNGRKVLFIAQNPSYAKPSVNKSDRVIMDKSASIEAVHAAYETSQRNWRFAKFIELVGVSWDEISIANVVRCPTIANEAPSTEMINNCSKYLLKTIVAVKPLNIISLGVIARKEVSKLERFYKCNYVYTHHYAFLMRRGTLETECIKIKKLLCFDSQVTLL